MWQIICLCLPAVTRSEQQRFFTLFREALRAYGRELTEMDLSLFFLHTLSLPEALTVLEERLRLVVRSLEQMRQPAEDEPVQDIKQWMIDGHLRALLEAEHTWLIQAITRLQMQLLDQDLDQPMIASHSHTQ
ncbi:hypothetical protein [Dictyobacter aurantiacus]|uniref:Transcription regulator PadR C-terminal domain-containing protein n=1 Tax=Dictyobacter aurantiacus TaxID=1936993 RepID=A0A401ZJK8_9CHLR|nr:hypothetical protein [Dictyobacter aurantiacus]GCE07029.1 hypothetical protein KDAU_43580 [Dictyobacter aurantiacus]